jgi:glycosyltransferase involved in cell wall biosynthesis
MKIAYITNFISPKFAELYCCGKSYSVSASLKSTGITRAFLQAGHEVTVFSPGLTICHNVIYGFTELLQFPEGTATIVYPTIISFPKCSVFNSIQLYMLLRRYVKLNYFDIFIYYNITIDAALNMRNFKNSTHILDYEDNIFNRARRGGRSRFKLLKKLLFRYVLYNSDGAIIVGKNMLSEYSQLRKVQIPGVINQENSEYEMKGLKQLCPSKPVKLLLAGGLHYSKGPDLMILALHLIETPCELHLYGGGVLEKNTKSLLFNLPSQHKVILHGFVENGELLRIMSVESNILINCTRNMGVEPQSEGYPFKMLEYASVGVPILSSRICKLDEEFNQHVNFYEIESPKEIAVVLRRIIENYESAIIRSESLKSLVLKRYSISGVSEKLDKFVNYLNDTSE